MVLDHVLERVGELWSEQKRRDLSDHEMNEMGECLEWIMHYVSKKRKLENLSLLASMTNDVDWLHEICRRIDELQSPKKKSGRKGTD